MRYPNLRYGNPTEMAYYAMGVPLADLARRLRRDQRTVRDWLNGRSRVPWWVPEILRLKRMEAELRHHQMGMGKLLPQLGIVGADVIALAQPSGKKALPITSNEKQQSGVQIVDSASTAGVASSLSLEKVS